MKQNDTENIQMKHMPRVTSLVMLLGLMLIAFAALATQSGCESKTEEAAASKESYTCPMHPSVLSDRPGACPVCNMALIKKVEEKPVSPEEAAMLATVSLSPTQRVMANVTTVAVRRGSMQHSLTMPGVLDFAEPLRAVVSARTRGRIEKLLINSTGAIVKKGQSLAELYSPDLISAQQELLSALNAPASGGSSSVGDFRERLVDAARERLRMVFGVSEDQIAEIEKSGKVRSTFTFRAPISGTVIQKSVVEGQYVSEATELYQVADLSRLWAWIEVPESDLRYVKVGGRVMLTVEAWPGESFPAVLTFVDPVMNAATRTVRVRAELGNPGGRLKPRMFVRAALDLQRQGVLQVPVSAIVRTGTRDLVWVEVRENQFEPRAVTVGARGVDEVEITSGLQEGDQVVNSGGYLLDSESRLQSPAAMRDVEKTIASPSTEAMTGVQSISITVDGGYEPETIRVKVGRPVRLLFTRNEESKCSEEIVIPEFRIKKYLPAYKTTPVEFTPTKTGKFRMTCGMDMLEGFIVVGK